MTYFRMLIGASALCLAVAAPARADLVITGGTANVGASGGTGIVSFTITSTSGDMLSALGTQLQITPLTGGSFLQFATSQPDPYIQPNYVFGGDSFGQTFGLPFWGLPSTTTTPRDTIAGGDATASGSAYTIDSSRSFLMSVEVQSAVGSVAGDSFSIALVPSSGTGNGNTYFLDQNGNPLDYTSFPATITLAASSAPEPNSFVLTALGCVGLLLYHRRSRRTSSPKALEGGAPSSPVTS